MNDALGNPVIEGAWYGYSKESNGVTTVVRAQVKYIKDGKARLTNCREYRSYGAERTDAAKIEPKLENDRTMTGRILFPIPAQEA